MCCAALRAIPQVVVCGTHFDQKGMYGLHGTAFMLLPIAIHQLGSQPQPSVKQECMSADAQHG